MSNNQGPRKGGHLRLIKPRDISDLENRTQGSSSGDGPDSDDNQRVDSESETPDPGYQPAKAGGKAGGERFSGAKAKRIGTQGPQDSGFSDPPNPGSTLFPSQPTGPGMDPANRESQQEGLSDLLTEGDERALARYLAIRERAPVEVRQYLSKKGILKSWHDAILERLMEMDLLNEERFCMNRIEHRLGSGQGPRRIQQELGSLGIERNTARDCLDCFDRHHWEESCLEVATRKLEGWMDREDSYWKLMQFLNYRGFESVHIEWAMNALKEKYPHWAHRFSSV